MVEQSQEREPKQPGQRDPPPPHPPDPIDEPPPDIKPVPPPDILPPAQPPVPPSLKDQWTARVRRWTEPSSAKAILTAIERYSDLMLGSPAKIILVDLDALHGFLVKPRPHRLWAIEEMVHPEEKWK